LQHTTDVLRCTIFKHIVAELWGYAAEISSRSEPCVSS
jgi:hypothetical protein